MSLPDPRDMGGSLPQTPLVLLFKYYAERITTSTPCYYPRIIYDKRKGNDQV